MEVDDYGAVSLDFRPVDVVRWETLEVSIVGLETEQELLDAVDSAVASCAEYAGGRSVVFRLTLAGRGPLHRWLRSAGTVEELRERVNEQYAPSTSSGQAWLWCERIQADTASPVDREQVALREDFAGDLARLSAELWDNPDALGELRDTLRSLYANSNAARICGTTCPRTRNCWNFWQQPRTSAWLLWCTKRTKGEDRRAVPGRLRPLPPAKYRPTFRPVTVFYGPNEAGKSTTLAFIRAVLFGFPARFNSHYPPLAGGRHGGRITVSDSAGAVYGVERYAGARGGLSIATDNGPASNAEACCSGSPATPPRPVPQRVRFQSRRIASGRVPE